MLTNKNRKNQGEKDAYNVLPTLLYMGKVSPSGVQRHVVRAIDNLSSNSKFFFSFSFFGNSLVIPYTPKKKSL